MKKGISIWAFHDRTPDVCFPLAKECGYDGVEIALGEKGPVRFDSTEAEMKELRKKAESYGIEFYSLVCDICWDYSISASDPAVRKKAEDILIKQLELASYLGCDTILALAGMVQSINPGGEVVPYDIAYERAFESVCHLAKYAQEYKVNFAIENVDSKLLLSPMETRDFIDKVGNPWVKQYFDVGNVIENGYPNHWIDILGKRIAKVHFKDVGLFDDAYRPVNILEGLVDYDAVMASLYNAGYDDWVTAEVFPAAGRTENDVELLMTNSKAMDRILKR